MFKDTVRGLDQIFVTDNYKDLVIAVMGYAGTLKSSFTYALMSQHLRRSGKMGMYVTLEQSKESMLRNITNLGIIPYDGLQISDFNRTRELFRESKVHKRGKKNSDIDLLELTEHIVNTTRKEFGDQFELFCLDSMNVLYALMGKDDLRERLYYFFKLLRDNKLTSFVVKEIPRDGGSHYAQEDEFLVDGVIKLGIHNTGKEAKRYIEVLKMRENEHSMRPFVIKIERGSGLSILGPLVTD